MEKLLISNSPHVRCNATTRRIMLDVFFALCPASIMGVVYFGWRAAVIIVISLLSAIASEVVYKLITGKKPGEILKEFDFTSAVTGLLLAMNLPSTVPFYLPVFGSVFAIIVVKMLFGGTGKNFVNPAIAGRIFLFISFSKVMTSGWAPTSIGVINGNIPTTGATVLSGAVLKNDLKSVPSLLYLLLGTGISGCIGETCKLALIIGGAYLVIRKVIDFKPLIYILVTGLMTSLIYGDFAYFLPSVLSGGLILGAIFMATDYVTCPNTRLGSYVYYLLLGVLTAWLRVRNGMEVVSFVIMLGNIAAPLIDRFVVPKPFGYQKPPRKKEKEVN